MVTDYGVGIHEGISNRKYHNEIDALNSSKLKNFANCPDYYQYKLANPDDPDKDSFRIGSAVDCMVLEPDKFASEFAIMEDVNLRTKEGKTYKEQFVYNAGLNGQTWLAQKEYDYCLNMAEAAKSSVLFAKYLSGGKPQLTYIWEQNGIYCKARPDYYIEERNLIVDLKTTKKDLDSFGYAVADFDYLLQAAYYSEGLYRLTGKMPNFAFFAVCKEEPHYCGVYIVPNELMQLALTRVRAILVRYKKCKAESIWQRKDKEFVLSATPSYRQRLEVEAC